MFEERHPDWLGRVRAIAVEIAGYPQYRAGVTIDDVRDHIGKVPQGTDPRILGAVFKGQNFRVIGYRKSLREESNGRPIAIFKLT